MTNCYVNWKAWEQIPFGQFTEEQRFYFAAELETSRISSIRGLLIGELGFGNGHFAGWVRERGGQWIGREAIHEQQKKASDAGYRVLSPEATWVTVCGADSLDLIVAFDVIEHLSVDAILDFLKEAREVLKPGGSLVFRVPSGDSPFSGAIFNGDLTHRTLLGSSAVRQLALEVGLEVAQIRPPASPVWGLGVRRALRRAAALFAQKMIFSIIRNIFMGNSEAVISPTMVVVLVKAVPLEVTVHTNGQRP